MFLRALDAAHRRGSRCSEASSESSIQCRGRRRHRRAQRGCCAEDPPPVLRANLKSISHRRHLFDVAFLWELTKGTIHFPQGCLQGGMQRTAGAAGAANPPPNAAFNADGGVGIDALRGGVAPRCIIC